MKGNKTNSQLWMMIYELRGLVRQQMKAIETQKQEIERLKYEGRCMDNRP